MGVHGAANPYSSSSKHEFHEEQRYVNGQPVYEKRHERRFEDGRLVHEDGHETGDPSLTGSLPTQEGSAFGGSGQGYRSSSRSSSSSSRQVTGGTYGGSGLSGVNQGYGSGSTGVNQGYGSRSLSGVRDGYSLGSTGVNQGYGSRSLSREDYASRYGSTGLRSSNTELAGSTDEFRSNVQDEVEKLRQQLHQGTSVIRAPVTATSVHEEKVGESHFVDGQQVYRRNEEKRYEDGRLVHNVAEEEGDKSDRMNTTPLGTGSVSRQHEQQNRYLSSGSSQDQRPSHYNPSSATSYRASYWRPGDRAHSRTSSTHSSTSSSGHQSGSIGSAGSNVNMAGPNRIPHQSSYTGTNVIRSQEIKPAYRASYTPSRSAERTGQRIVISSPTTNSQISSSSRRREYATSSGYRNQMPSISVPQSGSYNSEHDNRFETQSAYEQNTAAPVMTYSMAPKVVSQVSSSQSQQQYSSSYGSGDYSTPTEPPATSQTTSKITDRHSVPYSLRSSSYQPSRFANYSAWSHWKKDSAHAPIPPITSGSSYSSSHYEQTHSSGNTDSQSNRQTDLGSSGSLETRSQTQTVNALRPGYLFDEDGDYEDENESDHNEELHGSSRSKVSQQEEQFERTGESSYSSGSFSSNTPSTSDGLVRAGSGSKVDLSIMVDVGEGESVRLGRYHDVNADRQTPERYDISPVVDGGAGISAVGNEIDSGYLSSTRTSSSSSVRESSSSHGGNMNLLNNSPSFGQSGYSSQHEYERGLHYDNNSPVIGSTYGTTQITNRTTNTMTSRLQPLVSSYKLETRTSRKYLNGKLVSETKFNRYYENGALVHENQTKRSRDEMQTDGIDVTQLDLSVEDMTRYGMINPETLPMPHSQQFEMREEKEFVDGNQIYQATHEKHYLDGELVHEDHNEKDRNELVGQSGNLHINSIFGGKLNDLDRNNQYSSSSYNERAQSGRHNTGVDESVNVSVLPTTRTRKTEIRQEQEYRDGQQVYDMRHERQFQDGHLVHEDLSQKGPNDLGTDGHHDAMHDILSGRTLATASRTGYITRPASTHYSQTNKGQSSTRSFDGISTADINERRGHESSNNAYESQSGSSNYHEAQSLESQQTQGQIGTNLLTSGSLTNVIGGEGAVRFDSLNNAPSLSTGTGRYSDYGVSNSHYNHGGGYAMIGGSGSGYGGTHSQSGSSNIGYSPDSVFESNKTRSSGTYGNSEFTSSGNFGANIGSHGPSQSVSHRREMEVEEHYENGQLVSGKEEDKEWKNDNLLRHNERRYGEVSLY